MSDTPPYYWLNGEDGPLEKESRPPPDGVLAARPMSGQTGSSNQNGPLIGIDLSRNKDRKRHGYEGGPPPTLPMDGSGIPGGPLRPPLGLQVPGLAVPALHQLGGASSAVPRCNSMPGACGPPMSPFANCRPGPPLPTPQQTQCYPPPAAISPNMAARWPANGATALGASAQQGPLPAQQQVQGQAQVPTRNLVRAPSSVQRRPMSPSPAARMQTPPASPGAWTRKVGTPGGELQNSSSFHRSANVQKTNSFIAGNSAIRSSSFTAAPPDGLVCANPGSLPSTQSFTAAPANSPLGNGGPMMYPPSPPSTHGSFVAHSPAGRPNTVVPPNYMRMQSGNAYSPAQGPRTLPPHVFAPSPQFVGPMGGTWSAPVPGLAIPRPTTPLMETRGSMGSAKAGNIRRMRETHPPRPANGSHPVDIHHELMMQGSVSRATSSTDGQRHQRTPPAHQRSPPAQERVRVRKVADGSAPQTSSPTTSPWPEVRSTSQSPAMSSYSFGQTVTAASESADGRSSSLAAGHSDGRHIQVPTQVRQTAIQVPVHTRSYHPELVRRKNEPLRILVSGATGLLGRQVLHALQGFNVRGLCRSRCKATQLVSCDLTAEGEATRQIEDFNPHIVIHLAGERRSDVIRRSPARSRLLNVDASGALAAACEFCGAWLIFISSDAVFDGSSSPYAEDDSPNPVSEYGWHKLHAEKIVLAACPRAAVLRLPLLYGPVEFAAESVVTEIYSELRIGMQELDHYQRHYPTWACDVAEVIRAMVDMHTSGKEVRGIFHWQGGEQFTKYDIGMIIASACGFPAPRPILRDSNAGADAIAHDARLDCSRLQGLLSTSGISLSFTPLREGLRSCLEVFHDARLDTSKSACKVEASPHVAPTHVDEALRQAVVDPSQTRPPTHETTREMQNNSSFQDTVSQNVIDSSTPHGTRYVPVERASAPESSSLRESTETSEQRDKKEQSRLQSLSLRSEDGHAARAAALKNVFREELELAWRRYRDAAYEENGSETSHKLFGNDEHRGVLV